MYNLILKHEGFDEYLVSKKPLNGGISYRFRFENGYGASVVKHRYSYGSLRDLWELSVMKWSDGVLNHCYDTEITDDDIGYLTDENVRELLQKIKDL